MEDRRPTSGSSNKAAIEVMRSRGTVCFSAVGAGVGGALQDVTVHMITNASFQKSETVPDDQVRLRTMTSDRRSMIEDGVPMSELRPVQCQALVRSNDRGPHHPRFAVCRSGSLAAH
jgi:hypothetical protein